MVEIINYVTVKDLSEQWKIKPRTVYRYLEEFRKHIPSTYLKDSYIANGITRIEEPAFRHYMFYKKFFDNHCHVPKYRRGEW